MNIKKIIISIFLLLFSVSAHCGVSQIPGLFPQIGGIPGIQFYQNNYNKYYWYPSLAWKDNVSKQPLTIELEAARYNEDTGTELAENQASLDSDGTLNVGPGAYEQLILKSEDISDGVWSATTGAIVTATTFKADSQYDGVSQNITTTEGELYSISFIASVPEGAATTGYRFKHTNSATGTASVLILTTTPTRYGLTVLGRIGGGLVSFGLQDNNASDFATVTITDFQVTASPYRKPYAPNDSAVSTRVVLLNNSNADDGYSYPIANDLLDAFDGEADGITINSGNLVSATKYKVITTETDHFGAGVVIGDRVTGLTTALDANNTVQTISTAQGELVAEWMPMFDYDVSGIAAGNIINLGDTALDPIRLNATGGIELDDGTTVATAAALNWPANQLYRIHSIWGPTSELSSEKVVNGDFATGDLTSWSGGVPNDGASVNGSNQLVLDYAVATNPRVAQTITSIANRSIVLTYEVISNNTVGGSFYTYTNGLTPSATVLEETVGTHSIDIDVTIATPFLYLRHVGASSGSIVIDNISIKATNQPKMQLIVHKLNNSTKAIEATYESAVTDFVGRFPVGDYMKFGYDNEYWQKFITKPVIYKEPQSW